MGHTLAERITKHSSASILTTPGQSFLHSMVMLPTDESEVESLIDNLKTDCAAGRDKISASFIKTFKNVLIPPITHICNLAISSGIFPTIFKKAQIIPIFKSGDRGCVNNYRPISIVPTMSKILERLINKRLVKFLEDNNILSCSQFGFRTG